MSFHIVLQYNYFACMTSTIDCDFFFAEASFLKLMLNTMSRNDVLLVIQTLQSVKKQMIDKKKCYMQPDSRLSSGPKIPKKS